MVKNIFKKANWIWRESEGQADEYGEFYSSFNYDGEKNVKLKISADSNYAVYINGKFEVFGQYADFPYDKIYDEARKHHIPNLWDRGTLRLRMPHRAYKLLSPLWYGYL